MPNESIHLLFVIYSINRNKELKNVSDNSYRLDSMSLGYVYIYNLECIYNNTHTMNVCNKERVTHKIELDAATRRERGITMQLVRECESMHSRMKWFSLAMITSVLHVCVCVCIRLLFIRCSIVNLRALIFKSISVCVNIRWISINVHMTAGNVSFWDRDM